MAWKGVASLALLTGLATLVPRKPSLVVPKLTRFAHRNRRSRMAYIPILWDHRIHVPIPANRRRTSRPGYWHRRLSRLGGTTLHECFKMSDLRVMSEKADPPPDTLPIRSPPPSSRSVIYAVWMIDYLHDCLSHVEHLILNTFTTVLVTALRVLCPECSQPAMQSLP